MQTVASSSNDGVATATTREGKTELVNQQSDIVNGDHHHAATTNVVVAVAVAAAAADGGASQPTMLVPPTSRSAVDDDDVDDESMLISSSAKALLLDPGRLDDDLDSEMEEDPETEAELARGLIAMRTRFEVGLPLDIQLKLASLRNKFEATRRDDDLLKEIETHPTYHRTAPAVVRYVASEKKRYFTSSIRFFLSHYAHHVVWML
jgi:hypothetical protein